MPTDAPPASPARQRPRTALLVLLGIAVGGLVAYWLWPATSSSAAGPSNQQRTAGAQATGRAGGGAAPIDVRIDALKTPPPEPSDADRNPFRFQPKAPPPSPPMPKGATGPGGRDAAPQPPPGPPPIPPIPLKFIGTLEGRGAGKIAIFSDSKGAPLYGREGDIILGQYRIVRIGVESVVMEYTDGRGRQTIPLRG